MGSIPAVRTMLNVSGLHLWRGDRHLLKGVGFSLAPGQALQLLWPNGTGKTSLLRCVAGFLHAELGQVDWDGRNVSADRDAFHWNLAYLGHELALKGDLSAFENLRHSCALRTPVAADHIRAVLDEVGLGRLDSGQPVRSFSAGQQRRVALARLQLWGARLWLLDEPAANLDADGQRIVASMLQVHLAAGGMALLATHQAIELTDIDNRIWRTVGEAL